MSCQGARLMREGPVEQLLEMLRHEIAIAVEAVLSTALPQALDDALERHASNCCERRPEAGPDAARGADAEHVYRTREEAAAQLRVKVSTLDRYRSVGRIPWHRASGAVNGRVLIKQTDIDAFVRCHRRDGRDAAEPSE
jgi:hypothetical protein